jgi:hypothetical protein
VEILNSFSSFCHNTGSQNAARTEILLQATGPVSISFKQISFLIHAVSLLPAHLCNHKILKIDKTTVTATEMIWKLRELKLSTDDRRDKKFVLKKAEIMFQEL